MRRAIRTISSDRGKIVSGADDQSVIVWDKQTFKLLEELKGHEAPVRILQNSCRFILMFSLPHFSNYEA
jgi:WD40 repeat protein